VTVFVGVLFLVSLVLFLRAKAESLDDDKEDDEKKSKKTREEKIADQKGINAASRLVGDQVVIGKLQGGGSSGSESSPADQSEPYRSDSQVFIDRVKIIYGWLQIFTAITFTFDDIPWPLQLRSMSLNFYFINFDIGNILSESACSFAIPFLQKMVVHMMLPLVLLLALFVAQIPACMLRKKVHRKKQKALFIKLVSSLTLILYPGICTRLFSSLKVVSIEGLKSATHSGRVLAMDYSVEAFGEDHMPYVYVTILCMFVYVLGIPLSVVLALQSNRKYLYSRNHGKTAEERKNEGDLTEEEKEIRRRHHDVVDEFGTLYLQYEPTYWYWEVTVMLKKMLLTGAMTIIAPGSSVQLVIALLVVSVNMLLVLKLMPFVDFVDDWLAFLTSVQMVLTLLGGLLLMTDQPSSPTYDSNSMGVTLVVINSFAFIALFLSLLMLIPKVRFLMTNKCCKNRVAKKNISGRNGRDSEKKRSKNTKVAPTNDTGKIGEDEARTRAWE
jgi:hypothetical protein